MRRVLIVPTVVALVVGSITAASAFTGVPVPDLLTGDFQFREAPDLGVVETVPEGQIEEQPDARSADGDPSAERPDTPGQAATPAARNTPAAAHLPDNDHARGMVFDGLRPGAQDGPCADGFEIPLPNGKALCTHGPDEAPPGVDARSQRSTADLKRATRRLAASTEGDAGLAAEAGGVACIGDGVSGSRVQAVYAVAADRTDRYTEIAPLIQQWAGNVDDVFAQSAAQVGGERHVRFHTDADCTLDVAHVVLSPSGDDNIMNTINEMAAAGYNRSDRKYLIWMDASMYCGIAQIFRDDRPGQDNLSNVRSGYARVDQQCWGGTYSTEAHELVHSLGGVQPTAPHASANFHCTDEEDRMCYKDAADVVLTFDCPVANAHYLDCNHDDYYHPSPPAGSYLDSHWNVADSSYLHRGPIGDPQPPGNEAPVVDAGPDMSVSEADPASLIGVVDDDGLPGPALTLGWTTSSGPGDVTFDDAAAAVATASFSATGTYVLELTANDGELTTSDTVNVTVDSGSSAPVEVTEIFEAGLNKRFPSRTHEVEAADGAVTATLIFTSNRKGKNARSGAVLTVTVFDSVGNALATAEGASPVGISLDLPAGAYRFEVTGTLRISYRLEVTHLAM